MEVSTAVSFFKHFFWLRITLFLMFAWHCEKHEKTSLYKGVYWQREIKKWHVQLSLKEKKTKYGGTFNNEKDAVERVNQLCEELGIPLQNPEISAIPNQQYQVTKKFVLPHGIVRKFELQKFIFSISSQIFISWSPTLFFKLNIIKF